MIPYLIGLVAVAIFAWLLRVLGALTAALSVIDESKSAAATIRDPGLSDEQKEQKLQKSSLTIFGLFFKLLFLSGIALAVPGLAIIALDYLSVSPAQQVMDAMISWHFIALATILSVIAFVIPIKKRSNNNSVR